MLKDSPPTGHRARNLGGSSDSSGLLRCNRRPVPSVFRQFCVLDPGVGFVRGRRHACWRPVAPGANVDRQRYDSRLRLLGPFSLLGGAALLGHLLVGALLDRFSGAKIAALVLLLSGLGGRWYIGIAQSRILILAFTGLLGAALGADVDLLPYLMSRYFSLKTYGELLGYAFATGTVGSSLSTLLMGRVFDLSTTPT